MAAAAPTSAPTPAPTPVPAPAASAAPAAASVPAAAAVQQAAAAVRKASKGSAGGHPFKGRTLGIVNDLTRSEQWYVYQKVRELKEAIREGRCLDEFRLRNPESAVYTIFMEDSTRTKESFRNAAEFHGMKVNVFDAKTSSFQKNETITDTIKMLCGYSVGQSIFVIRSKVEGVCTWLDEAIGAYTKQMGYPRASFVNAGDGRHEHPSQELLDEFSFLEHKGWDAGSIHLALIGDLNHGRTVHSKVDGLRIYRNIEVDLIAPEELALPKQYEDKMLAYNFKVRKFESIEQYLQQPKVSKIWYFTRLQLERMGEKVLEKAPDLRRAVTFSKEFMGRLPEGTKFFHPLPRDSRWPELPYWLDSTPLNGWDQQSQNGYFTRIVILGMLGGHFGADFLPEAPDCEEHNSPILGPESEPVVHPTDGMLACAQDFIQEVVLPEITEDEELAMVVGLEPLTTGIVIANLAEGQSPEKIWGLMYMVRSILGLQGAGGHGVYNKSGVGPCGYISCPLVDISGWGRQPLKKLAAMAPGSRLRVVKDGRILKEYRLQVPPRIYNFREIACKNTACVCHPSQLQHEVPTHFIRAPAKDAAMRSETSTWAYACKYCDTVHGFWEVWDYSRHSAK